MRDPSTLAFTIPQPWPRRDQWSKKHRLYWPPLISIWHVDPERDGTDNSCGWPFAKFGEADAKLLDELAEWDKSFPYYGSPSLHELTIIMDPAYSFRQLPPGQAFGFIAAAWAEIKARKGHGRELTAGEISRIMSLACNPHGGLRTSLTDDKPEYCVRRFLGLVMRQYLTYRRPWWRHPRWHIHHWRFQVHPWQHLRRAFQRCHGCGKRLGYGYCPTAAGGGHERPEDHRGPGGGREARAR